MRISQMSRAMGISSLYLNKATSEMDKSSKRISSGKKLNTDLVGELGKLNTLKAHRSTVNVDTSNLNSAKDYLNIKDGALSEITTLAQKITEIYGKGDVTTGSESETAITQYTAEINNILSSTTYNGNNVFSKDDTSIGSVTISKSSLVKSDGTSNLDFSDATKAAASLSSIVKETATVGAISDGVDSRISVNTTMASNLDEAISRIEDVDVTEETINYNTLATKQQIAASMINSMQQSQSSILSYFV
jgi:flagellin